MTTSRTLLLVLCVWLGLPNTATAQDALDETLALEGLKRQDLGFEPRGYWSRFPMDIPHKLRHFDALFAEPLATVTFARTASDYARNTLSPKALATVPKKSNGALYRLVHGIGIERRFGALRAYSANLTPPKNASLTDAIMHVHQVGGRTHTTVTFGTPSPYPNIRRDIDAQLSKVPADVQTVLTALLFNLLDAHHWIELGFRRIPTDIRNRVARRYDLSVEITDGLEYMPDIDDAMHDLDEASLWYGGLKAVAALDEARLQLANLYTKAKAPRFSADLHTPLGWIRLRGGGNDTIPADGALLLVDLGGNDRYEGATAASSPGLPLSVALDLRGNDTYIAGDMPAQGSGMAGVGILVDVKGNDRYSAVQCSQGFAQLGLGVLADLEGTDQYTSRYASQGAALFGVGVVLEGAGNDTYQIHSDGQGYGGPGGVGTLADYSGDDIYEAVRDGEITQRPSYHAKLKIAVSNAQGVGFGRRGDGGDGHSWAGGLGQLLDLNGSDRYISGNWSQGTGYWFGTGILHDTGGGNDVYDGVVWSQGTGAHFCIGALIDEGGDDRHSVAAEYGRNSLAFGHDFAIALLLNIGGNDSYTTPAPGLGHSITRSYAMFFDVGGDDRYNLPKDTYPGLAPINARFGKRDQGFTYFADAQSLGLFLDVGGKDTYVAKQGANNANWRDPDDSPNRAVHNTSIGVDRVDGTVSFVPYR